MSMTHTRISLRLTLSRPATSRTRRLPVPRGTNRSCTTRVCTRLLMSFSRRFTTGLWVPVSPGAHSGGSIPRRCSISLPCGTHGRAFEHRGSSRRWPPGASNTCTRSWIDSWPKTGRSRGASPTRGTAKVNTKTNPHPTPGGYYRRHHRRPGSSMSADNERKHGGGVASLATPPPRGRSIGAVCVHPRGARPALGRPAHSPTLLACPVRAQAGPAMRP